MNQPAISRREIAERLDGITEDGVKYHLEKLKRDGRLFVYEEQILYLRHGYG